jgi:trehalose 6-phosphate synthase
MIPAETRRGDGYMPGLSKLLGLLAGPSEFFGMGSAACVGLIAALAHVTRRAPQPYSPPAAAGLLSGPAFEPVEREFLQLEDRAPRTELELRTMLRAQLADEQVIVLSNREPCIHEMASDGEITVRRPASGLVTALEPVVCACGGVWVAHGSGTADRVTSDRHGRVVVDADGAPYLLRRVWLSTKEERGYYCGFANEGLWPLCHMAFSAPVFRRSDWLEYERVNRRFADAVAAEIKSTSPIVLVQDYHFALVPRMLRERCPDVITVAFWHIPWPNPEQFKVCPYGPEILDGLLGSSILGFQTAQCCRNFIDTADLALGSAGDRDRGLVVHRGMSTQVRPYPISVEWPNRWAARAPSAEECRQTVRAEFGIESTAQLVVSVDRLDYTKGFEERLAAIERLLELNGSGNGTVFLHIACPTRVALKRYADFAARVRARIDDLNERFGNGSFRPVIHVERYIEPADVFRYYRAADVCYVGSLDDGMNLVAKEFVSARDDERGTLVLSRFAGASRELKGAVIVNPYDIDGVADALNTALTMPEEEQCARMRDMRAWIADHNVYRWAGEMLADAARCSCAAL